MYCSQSCLATSNTALVDCNPQGSRESAEEVRFGCWWGFPLESERIGQCCQHQPLVTVRAMFLGLRRHCCAAWIGEEFLPLLSGYMDLGYCSPSKDVMLPLRPTCKFWRINLETSHRRFVVRRIRLNIKPMQKCCRAHYKSTGSNAWQRPSVAAVPISRISAGGQRLHPNDFSCRKVSSRLIQTQAFREPLVIVSTKLRAQKSCQVDASCGAVCPGKSHRHIISFCFFAWLRPN